MKSQSRRSRHRRTRSSHRPLRCRRRARPHRRHSSRRTSSRRILNRGPSSPSLPRRRPTCRTRPSPLRSHPSPSRALSTPASDYAEPEWREPVREPEPEPQREPAPPPEPPPATLQHDVAAAWSPTPTLRREPTFARAEPSWQPERQPRPRRLWSPQPATTATCSAAACASPCSYSADGSSPSCCSSSPTASSTRRSRC